MTSLNKSYNDLKSLTPNELLNHLEITVQMAKMAARCPTIKTYMPDRPAPILFEIGDFEIRSRFHNPVS
jgi:hypothetical protein